MMTMAVRTKRIDIVLVLLLLLGGNLFCRHLDILFDGLWSDIGNADETVEGGNQQSNSHQGG